MVEVFPRCRSREVSAKFQQVLADGWNLVFDRLQREGRGVIRDLGGIEVSLLDDREMSEVHGEFLDDPTPTDVITFEHGELLIGVEVAERQARDFKTRVDHEVALYGIHGMLHLSGYDDQRPADFRVMEARQEELFQEVFGPLFGETSFF